MQLIEIERATEEIASDFSTRLITSPSHKKLRIPEFFSSSLSVQPHFPHGFRKPHSQETLVSSAL